jgi:hypothetical protein
MKPGDLVRIRCGPGVLFADDGGPLGVIVNVRFDRGRLFPNRIAEVLVDGKVRPFYFDYLELVDATG